MQLVWPRNILIGACLAGCSPGRQEVQVLRGARATPMGSCEVKIDSVYRDEAEILIECAEGAKPAPGWGPPQRGPEMIRLGIGDCVATGAQVFCLSNCQKDALTFRARYLIDEDGAVMHAVE